VQTVCEYCRSILVRRDVDMARVGTVGDLPENASPIQLGVEGVYRDVPFVVVGRILYEYERGGWNEWHIVYNNGASGWLSDAQAEYAVYSLAPSQGLPPAASVKPGLLCTWKEVAFQATTVTRARYRGVEGELPFEYWDKQEVVFADFRTAGAFTATIDYSEATPLLFLGEFTSFHALRLKNVREFEGWPRP
jgi:hypothetical protein